MLPLIKNKVLPENYFSTGKAQKRATHVKQLFLKKCSVKDWRRLLVCNIAAACVGKTGRLGLALVRKCPALHTSLPVKPVSQPHSGTSHWEATLHTLTLEPLAQILSVQLTGSHTWEVPRKAKGYLRQNTGPTQVLTLPLPGF